VPPFANVTDSRVIHEVRCICEHLPNCPLNFVFYYQAPTVFSSRNDNETSTFGIGCNDPVAV
jgi:hypothetical protein